MPDRSYHKNANAALLIGATGSFLGNVNGSIVTVMLPTLSQAFQRGIGDMTILTLAFLLSQTLTLFIAGRLCDVKSSRTIFLWGFGLHSLSTLLCVFASTLELLAACRLIQGVASALITVCASVAVLRYVSLKKRGQAFGTITLSATLGFAVGPSLGGMLLEFIHWRYVFLLICGIGIVLLFLTYGFYHDDRIRERRFVVDPISVIFSSITIVSFFVMLIAMTRLDILHPLVGVIFLMTAINAMAFVKRCFEITDPLLSLSVLRHFSLVTALGGSFCNTMFSSGLVFILPFYFIFVRGLPEHQMGLLMMTIPLAGLLGSWLGGKLTDSIGAKQTSLVTAVVGVPVLLAMTGFHHATSLGVLVPILAVFGFSYIFYRTSCTTMIMSWAKPGEEGKLSAIRLLIPVLGNAVGISVFAIFFDNSIVPTVDRADEILGNFHHAVWLGLVIVVIQIFCTLRSKCAEIPPHSLTAFWRTNDSFLDRG